jgi:hypothetical protein
MMGHGCFKWMHKLEKYQIMENINSHAVHEMSLPDLKVGVYAALNVWRITGPTSFYEKNFEHYASLSPFFSQLTD